MMVMDAHSLFSHPRSPEAEEFERLAGISRELDQRVHELEHQRDDAARVARERSSELAEAERQRAAGGDVSTDVIRKRERSLAAARAKVAEAWPERIAGARAAAREATDAAHRFAAAHYPELAYELRAEAEAAAAAVDDAMRGVLAARLEHAAVSQRAFALIATAGGRSRPDAVPYPKTDGVASAIDAVFLAGGESIPAGPPTLMPANAEVEEVVA